MGKIHRFYLKKQICEGKVRIEGEEARHIQVLRLHPGDQMEIFNNQGTSGLGTILKVCKDSIELNIDRIQKVRKNMILRVLASSAPKNKRFDMLVQKATELGVDEIIPISTKRTIVQPRETKIERLKRIAVEAAKQSGRNHVPEISQTITIEELMKRAKEFDLKLILDPKGKKIKEALTNVRPKKIICLIGPEGGFNDEEIETAKRNGFIPVSLGAGILRVETAGIAILSTINYEFGD